MIAFEEMQTVKPKMFANTFIIESSIFGILLKFNFIRNSNFPFCRLKFTELLSVDAYSLIIFNRNDDDDDDLYN